MELTITETALKVATTQMVSSGSLCALGVAGLAMGMVLLIIVEIAESQQDDPSSSRKSYTPTETDPDVNGMRNLVEAAFDRQRGGSSSSGGASGGGGDRDKQNKKNNCEKDQDDTESSEDDTESSDDIKSGDDVDKASVIPRGRYLGTSLDLTKSRLTRNRPSGSTYQTIIPDKHGPITKVSTRNIGGQQILDYVRADIRPKHRGKNKGKIPTPKDREKNKMKSGRTDGDDTGHAVQKSCDGRRLGNFFPFEASINQSYFNWAIERHIREFLDNFRVEITRNNMPFIDRIQANAPPNARVDFQLRLWYTHAHQTRPVAVYVLIRYYVDDILVREPYFEVVPNPTTPANLLKLLNDCNLMETRSGRNYTEDEFEELIRKIEQEINESRRPNKKF